ncbi:MAG: aldo/keto reductase [Thermoleophilia bacterium]|nr:aldo/keto reductase [Thermoleophilia bacterium]MDH3725517.1 aldo/keto reductase [Thermoleophilia bacterium]
MERRTLGSTDIELSVIGIGTWVFGGRWGGADDAQSEEALHAAIDAGINWVDTADIYGQGRAERVVGEVLAERGGEILVSTKGGVAWELEPEFRIWRDASRDYLRMALDRSLEALGRDSVDIYHVHWPVASVPIEETIGALVELRDEGKIRAIAVSNYDLNELEQTAKVAPIDAYQPGYHLMRRDIEAGELPWCADNQVGVLAYGPLAHGLLTGKMGEQTTFPSNDWRAESELFTDEAYPQRVAVTRELARIADDAGRPGGVAELAVGWVLRRPEITSAIIGMRDGAQARENAALAGAPLRADEEAEIEAVLAKYPNASRPYGHGEPPDPGAE